MKYRNMNDFVWATIRCIVLTIIVALTLLITEVNTIEIAETDKAAGVIAIICYGILHIIVCATIINGYNSIRRRALIEVRRDLRYVAGRYHIEPTIIKGNKVLTLDKRVLNRNAFSPNSRGSSADEDDDEEYEDVLDEQDGIGKVYKKHTEKTRAGSEDIGTQPSKKDKSDKKSGSALDKVQGIDELKGDIERIIDSLVNPEKYAKLGAKPTKGVILYGPPGTGKTMIGRAIAEDAKATFIQVNGSEFIEKYVGVGAGRVRKLFERAKKNKPAIIFIDEIDAVAGSRDKGDTSESVQTVNALLSELDGFENNEGLLVIGATNRVDALDEAFTRAGRFDLKLSVSLPDKEGRKKILKEYAENKPLNSEVKIDDLASKTVGFSGAELENLLNEAALIAGSLNKTEIDTDDMDNAFFKIIMNGHKKKAQATELEVKIIAWHESGHTLAIKKLTDDDVSSVTIIGSTSGAGGVTFRSPKERVLESKKDLENQIITLYAGRAAEQVLLGSAEEITTGASQDIKQATRIIKAYIEKYGMGGTGLIDTSQFYNVTGNTMKEAEKISQRLYKETVSFMEENKDTLEKLATTLMEKETLYESEIDQIINGGTVVNEE